MQFEVGALRNGLAELFALPDGYEVLLGNGGTTSVLGRRRLRADRSAQPAPAVRGVLVQVRRGGGRGAPPRRAGEPLRRAGHPPPAGRRSGGRRLLPHPQRDLHRRGDAARAARRTPTGSCSSTPPRPPAGCASTRRGRRLLLRPAEVPRVRRRSVARRRVAGGHRADRADRGVRSLGARRRSTSTSPSRTAARTRPTTRRRSPRCSSPTSRSTGSTSNGGLEWAAVPLRPVGRGHLRLGRGVELRHAVRRRARRSGATSSPRSTSTPRWPTPTSCRRCSATTASSTPRATASSAATSSGSPSSPPSSPTTSIALTRCIDLVVEAVAA